MNLTRKPTFLAACLSLAAFTLTAQNGSVSLAWNAGSSPKIVGYEVYYGEASGYYTSAVYTTNLSATIGGLTPGITYYFAAASYNTNNILGRFSTELSTQVPMPASITNQPSSQLVAPGTSVTLSVGAAGYAPLKYQWMNGTAPIAGATSSSYAIAKANAGNYSVIVSNAWGRATSIVAGVSLIAPPSIVAQPQPQTVVATTTATLTGSVSSTVPVSFQWYYGGTLLPGATSSVLILPNIGASNAGNYKFTASSVGGTVTSSAAILTVLPKSTFASEAGVYNGLFYQTNADGSANVTEDTAGFLGNCVVGSNGVFSATLYIAGQSYYWSSNFNANGTCGTTVIRSDATASALSITLQLNLTNGPQTMTGLVSNMTGNNAWTAPLVAVMATNAIKNMTGLTLSLTLDSMDGAPTNSGAIAGLALGNSLSMTGILGDGTPFSQNVAISSSGYVPIYVSLYNNGGLLAGWLEVSGGQVAGSLAWICPGGLPVPAGFPRGFETAVNVTGTTISK